MSTPLFCITNSPPDNLAHIKFLNALALLHIAYTFLPLYTNILCSMLTISPPGLLMMSMAAPHPHSHPLWLKITLNMRLNPFLTAINSATSTNTWLNGKGMMLVIIVGNLLCTWLIPWILLMPFTRHILQLPTNLLHLSLLHSPSALVALLPTFPYLNWELCTYSCCQDIGLKEGVMWGLIFPPFLLLLPLSYPPLYLYNIYAYVPCKIGYICLLLLPIQLW